MNSSLASDPICNQSVVCSHDGNCSVDCGGDHYFDQDGECLRCGADGRKALWDLGAINRAVANGGAAFGGSPRPYDERIPKFYPGDHVRLIHGWFPIPAGQEAVIVEATPGPRFAYSVVFQRAGAAAWVEEPCFELIEARRMDLIARWKTPS